MKSANTPILALSQRHRGHVARARVSEGTEAKQDQKPCPLQAEVDEQEGKQRADAENKEVNSNKTQSRGPTPYE